MDGVLITIGEPVSKKQHLGKTPKKYFKKDLILLSHLNILISLNTE
jgi:hypothetical protein